MSHTTNSSHFTEQCGYCHSVIYPKVDGQARCGDWNCLICEDCLDGLKIGCAELEKHGVFHRMQLQLPPIPGR